jgi:DNA polymerase (family 10)
VKNADVAEVFDQIAALLEIKGEDAFRVRAYQRVADTVRSLPQELADLRAEGELPKIPGSCWRNFLRRCSICSGSPASGRRR